jgi:long-subunit fatty acid transport protein
MGGSAIGYVDDASALVHNPAGLQGVQGLALTGNLSLLLGGLQASPDEAPSARGIHSELTVAPLFLAGVGLRLHPWLSLGAAFFPVASGGASYRYENRAGRTFDDHTRIVFLELTPAASLNVPRDLWLPGLLSFGIGYRLDRLDFNRTKGPPGNPVVIDLTQSGMSSGLRAGAQWKPSEALALGVVFRSKVRIESSGDRGTALAQPVTNPEVDFVLPAKFGAGARYDLGRWGFASDVEYGLYSQNGREPLRGEIAGMPGSITNVFAWHDAVTIHLGVEHRLGVRQNWPIRIGYVFDGQVVNERFPNAFGAPPVPSHTLTAGAGCRFGAVELDLAYTYRFSSADVKSDPTECQFCGFAGAYALSLHGLYVDLTADLPL